MYKLDTIIEILKLYINIDNDIINIKNTNNNVVDSQSSHGSVLTYGNLANNFSIEIVK